MTFKELLTLNKEASFPDQNRVQKRIGKKRFFAIRLLAIGGSLLTLLAVAGVALILSMHPAEKPKITVEGSVNIIESIVANDRSDLGMRVTSDLNITTTEEVTPEELKARLAISPERDFKIKRTGNCKYKMELPGNWEENTLYNVLAVYNENVVYSWAFQTETPFSITDAFPQNTQYVGLESSIEITFSHAAVENFESAFKIEPAVEGTFEHFGRTWAFLPKQAMAPATLYTVTVDPALKGPGGAELKEPFSFSFQTEAKGNYAYMVYRQNEVADTFLVDECPIAAIAYDGFKPKKASGRVYRLKNADSYIDAYQKYVRSGAVSADIMEIADAAVSEFNAAPIMADQYNDNGKTAFIHYPEPLPQGYYFAELVLENRKVYQLLQSTDLAVYTVSANGSYTAWVNDSITGKAVEGAEIYLDGKKKTKTNRRGFASFTGSSQEEKTRFLAIENGEVPYVIPVNGKEPDKDLSKQRAYYTYLTTSSSLYKTTDTIRVFGMVLPRKNHADVPDEITLKSDFSEDVTVELNKNGSFSADLPIERTVLSEGRISLWINGVEMDHVWVGIADYDLPSFILSVTTDRNTYREGETAEVSVAVTYPDGMPASGVSVTGDISGVTDQNGYITAMIPIEPESDAIPFAENTPQIRFLSCSVEEEQGYSSFGSAQFVVFNGDHLLKTSFSDGSLKVNVNSFDRQSLENLHPDALYQGIYEEDGYVGAPADVKISAEIHRVTYQKKRSGKSYDPISKKAYDTWSYTEVDTVEETVELTSVNGLINWEFKESSNEDERYYAVLRTPETETESAVQCELYEEGSIRENFGCGVYYAEAEEQTVEIGDSAQLAVCSSKNGEAISEGSVFYTVVAGEILDHYYGSTPEMRIAFKEEYAPEITVYGAYFDGEHIFDLGAEWIFYDLDQSKLQIAVECDQTSYEPGDEVSASVQVTDVNGKPVSAVVCVSILDRALYLTNHNAEDPLYAFYDRKTSGEVFATSSYRHFASEYFGSDEGAGEEYGGGDTRCRFETSPYWDVIETNRKGKATFTFKLPERPAEWKAVIKAFTDDVQGGCTVYDMASGTEYETSVVVGETLKTSDDCTVALKTDGRGVAEDAVCRYTVGLTDQEGNTIKTEKISALKSQYGYLNFGALDEGVYTLYVKSESGVYQDNVIRSFQVAKTRNLIRINQKEDLQAGVSLALEPAQGNVLLTVSDRALSFRQKVMNALAANDGERIDQALGAYFAEHYFVTGAWMDQKNLNLVFLQPYYSGGGLKLYAESEYDDLRLSAKVAAAMPKGCRREELIQQFQYYLNDRRASETDHLIACFGLAALGEPIMADLQSLYTSAADLTVEEAVYMALAFAYGGDYDTANYLYEQQIKAALKTEGELAYIENEGAVDDALTGSVSMLANRLSLEVADDLIQYLLDHNNDETLLSLDLITYLNHYVLDSDGKNIFTLHTASGEDKTYQYSRMSVLNIALSRDQAAEIRISPIEGTSEATLSYIGDLQSIPNAEGTVLNGVEYEKSIKCGAETTLIVPVSLPEDFKGASAAVTLPDGLRFVSGRIHCGTYGYNVPGGDASGNIKVSLNPDVKYIMLTVRGGIPGNYVVEPILIQNAVDQRYFVTDPMQITVTS